MIIEVYDETGEKLKQTLVKSLSDQKTLNLIKLSNNNLESERRLCMVNF